MEEEVEEQTDSQIIHTLIKELQNIVSRHTDEMERLKKKVDGLEQFVREQKDRNSGTYPFGPHALTHF